MAQYMLGDYVAANQAMYHAWRIAWRYLDDSLPGYKLTVSSMDELPTLGPHTADWVGRGKSFGTEG